MSTTGVTPEQRYTRNRRCPICDGCEQDPRSQEKRCVGFLSSDGNYARCSRKGTGKQDDLGCYVHRLGGQCGCGEQHGEQQRESTGKGPIVASYDYTDENGNLLYRVDRRVTPGRRKTFSQRRPDGRGGWIGDTAGVREVTWKLPDLMAADPAQLVFVVEGEKCAIALHKLRVVATTARGGTGGVKQWDSPEFCVPFKGRNVVVLPDVDEDRKGRRYAERVAKALAGVAASVKIVDLPGLKPVGEDVVQWIERGGTVEKLMELAATSSNEDAKAGPKPGSEEEGGTAETETVAGVYSDAGNAALLADRYVGSFRYVPGLGWLTWDGCRWRPDVENAEITQAANRMTAPWVVSEDRSLRRWGLMSQGAGKIKAMIELASKLPVFVVPVAQLDTDDWLLNCLNGTVDLRTGTLREHRREDLITLLAPVEFRSDAKAPQFEAFLSQVQPTPEMRLFLQKWSGLCLTGSIREQKVLLTYGPGGNGKSVYSTLMGRALGSYSAYANRSTFSAMQKPGGAPRSDLVRFLGKRLITTSELGVGQKIDEPFLKELSGGEKITARDLHKSEVEFLPKLKLVFSTNHLPEIAADDGIRRRLLVVPFDVKIPEEKQDKDFVEKLAAELPGILAWAVRGCLLYQRNGLGNAAAITSASKLFHSDNDTFGRWLASSALVDKEEKSPFKTPRRDIYASYVAWCKAEGEVAMPTKTFSPELRKVGVKDGTTMRTPGVATPVDAWQGIKLRVSAEPDDSYYIQRATERPS